MVERATFVARPRPELLATKQQVMAVVGGEPACLVNVLTTRAFRGEGTAYSRPGRIPGSVSVPAHDLLDQDTGCLRPSAALAREFGDLLDIDPAIPVIAYCGGGISATVDVFASRSSGANDVRLTTDRSPSGAQTRPFPWKLAEPCPRRLSLTVTGCS